MTVGQLVKWLVGLIIIAGIFFLLREPIQDFIKGYKEGKGAEKVAGAMGIAVDQGAAGVTGQTQIGAMQLAKTKITDADLNTIRNGIEVYRVDHNGQIPASLDELAKSGALGGSSIPKDPWGTPYESLVSGGKFYIISAGQDKIKGTQDDQTIDMTATPDPQQ
jgi:hypothetical protein